MLEFLLNRGTLALDILVVAILVFVYIPELDPDMSTFTSKEELQLSFVADWHDSVSDTKRSFALNYFPKDNSVEMYDLKLKRIFLSRIRVETVNPKDFYLGNTVVILSRRLVITDYANENTRHALEHSRESTFAMIKPDGLKHMGEIMVAAENEGFAIQKAKLTRLTRTQAEDFYQEHRERSFFDDLVGYITSGPVLALELMRSNAVTGWRSLLGPTDAAKARDSAPESIRARFGTDKTENAAHGSDSIESAARELDFFFPSDPSSSPHSPVAIANIRDSTCCIIKPHAVRDGLTGHIIADIQSAGFNISGLQTSKLRYEHAEEFYEIYKGVVHDYTGMVKQLSSGLSMILEISHPDSTESSTVVSRFRDLVGPSDPELARKLRPNSLRAKYGLKSTEENAIHCTDLPEDGKLEVEYFFQVLKPMH